MYVGVWGTPGKSRVHGGFLDLGVDEGTGEQDRKQGPGIGPQDEDQLPKQSRKEPVVRWDQD